MKILLLGGNGQLGFELHRALLVYGTIIATTRSGQLPDGSACTKADLADLDALAHLIESEQPNIIVNAAAYTAVDKAEQEPELANTINHLAPALLAAKARDLGALLIHFSSDYVYSGENSMPWRETDPTMPLGVYGKSKLAGDKAIIESKCAFWIIRTQWLYGARGSNFLRTMLQRAQAGLPLKVVNDQFGAPTPVRVVASAVLGMLARWLTDLRATGQSSTGVYHLSSREQCSWFDFAEAIFQEASNIGLLNVPVALSAATTAEFAAPAKRPRFGVLNCEKLTREFDLRLPNWQSGLRQTVAEFAGSEARHVRA
jgi:dTDP-4-dehydrorhamnose reductase